MVLEKKLFGNKNALVAFLFVLLVGAVFAVTIELPVEPAATATPVSGKVIMAKVNNQTDQSKTISLGVGEKLNVSFKSEQQFYIAKLLLGGKEIGSMDNQTTGFAENSEHSFSNASVPPGTSPGLHNLSVKVYPDKGAVDDSKWLSSAPWQVSLVGEASSIIQALAQIDKKLVDGIFK